MCACVCAVCVWLKNTFSELFRITAPTTAPHRARLRPYVAEQHRALRATLYGQPVWRGVVVLTEACISIIGVEALLTDEGELDGYGEVILFAV